MKIYCEVQILNRLLNGAPPNRFQKSTLAIGKTPKDDSQIFILHFTNTNKTGTRYNLKNNLENVFCKFVNEGKATLRFKEPSHDLCIKCEATQLKCFLKTLKCSITGEIPQKDLVLSNLSATSITKIKRPVTKLHITSRGQYPIKGFPRTLEVLSITGLILERFDKQILQLRNLYSLDLSNNGLKYIPSSLGNLPHLSILNLSSNYLCESKLHEWEWLNGDAIYKTLKTLQLTCNNLLVLPDNIVHLQELITLKVDGNMLQVLPNNIRRLKKLRNLYANKNNLQYLPHTMRELKLDILDISCNNLTRIPYEISKRNIKTITLIEHSARIILKHNIKYSPTSIPRSLCHYLDTFTECVCGKPIVDIYYSFVRITSNFIHITSLIHDSRSFVPHLPVKIDMCSEKCFKYFNLSQRNALLY